jgi:hypothetical protein
VLLKATIAIEEEHLDRLNFCLLFDLNLI